MADLLRSSEYGYKVTRDFTVAYNEEEEFFCVLFEITFQDRDDAVLNPPGRWIDTLTKSLLFVSVVPSRSSPETVFAIVIDARRAEPPLWKREANVSIRALTVGGMGSGVAETVATYRKNYTQPKDSDTVTKVPIVQSTLSFAPKRPREEGEPAAASVAPKQLRSTFDDDLKLLSDEKRQNEPEALEAEPRLLNALNQKEGPNPVFERAYQRFLNDYLDWLKDERALQAARFISHHYRSQQDRLVPRPTL